MVQEWKLELYVVFSAKEKLKPKLVFWGVGVLHLPNIPGRLWWYYIVCWKILHLQVKPLKVISRWKESPIYTRLQRRIVHLNEKKQIKQQFLRAKLCNLNRNQCVVTLSEHWPQNREFCTAHLHSSPTFSLKAFYLLFLTEWKPACEELLQISLQATYHWEPYAPNDSTEVNFAPIAGLIK